LTNNVQKVIDLVRYTAVVDTGNTEKICEMQDILNVTGEDVEQIWEEVEKTGNAARLVWIVATVSGYATLDFYLMHGREKKLRQQLDEAAEELRQLTNQRMSEATIQKEHENKVNELLRTMDELYRDIKLLTTENKKYEFEVMKLKAKLYDLMTADGSRC